jgi:hypothetical protein
LSGNPVIDWVPWGKNRLAASVAGKFDVRCDMTTTEVLAEEQVLAEPFEIDLRWRAESMGVGYLPLTSWFELDLLSCGSGSRGSAS